MNGEYCPECGMHHEIITARCPNRGQVVWPDNTRVLKQEAYDTQQDVHEKLDIIIELLKEIEYLLRIK